MKLSDEGLEKLKQLEGSVRHLYRDVGGYLTIGVGHLITSEEEYELYKNKQLSDEEILSLLKEDVGKFEQNINERVKVPLTQNQFDALVLFSFNVGNNAFNFSTLLKRLNAGAYSEVPYQLSRWDKVGGKVFQGLVNRRNAEIDVWLYGYGA
jgi:lysozyme